MIFNICEEFKDDRPLISIIVPVYNEEKTIDEVLSRIISLENKLSIEIIVVDDGSKDNTSKIVKKYNKIIFIQHENNYGKGAAIKSGINKSTGHIIIIQDADLEYSPEDIPRLVKPILDGSADVVFGSRFLGKIEGMSYSHYIGNKILSFFAQLLYGQNITDIMTGHKAINKSIFKNINLTKRRFEVEIEITSKILKNGFRLVEVPIYYKYRTTGQSKIKFKDGLSSLIELFLFRFLK